LTAVQRAFEGQLQRAQEVAQQKQQALEGTMKARLEAQAQEHVRTLAEQEQETIQKVVEVNSSWRRQMDEAHNKFAEERARLTAEGQRKVQEVEAEGLRKFMVSLSS
jgi:hypothetical protein